MKVSRQRLLVELLLSAGFIGFPLFLFPNLISFMPDERIRQILMGIFITHSYLACFYFLNVYFLLPRYYYPKKFGIFFLLVLACLFSLILILQSGKGFSPFDNPPFRSPALLFMFTILVRFIMVFALSFGISSWMRLKKIEEEGLKAELSFLRAQINPHFLFNTLNSVYALSVIKSDKAPEAITRLSQMMRYVTREAVHEKVSLENELNYILAYIELEKLRMTPNMKLYVEHTGDFGKALIAPLILLPLVENVFKHGITTSKTGNLMIKINFRGNELILETENEITNSSKNSVSGMGLSNLKKRLELLYPHRHHLRISESANKYQTLLRISLDD